MDSYGKFVSGFCYFLVKKKNVKKKLIFAPLTSQWHAQRNVVIHKIYYVISLMLAYCNNQRQLAIGYYKGAENIMF